MDMKSQSQFQAGVFLPSWYDQLCDDVSHVHLLFIHNQNLLVHIL